jgi:hypothetical protein
MGQMTKLNVYALIDYSDQRNLPDLPVWEKYNVSWTNSPDLLTLSKKLFLNLEGATVLVGACFSDHFISKYRSLYQYGEFDSIREEIFKLSDSCYGVDIDFTECESDEDFLFIVELLLEEGFR